MALSRHQGMGRDTYSGLLDSEELGHALDLLHRRPSTAHFGVWRAILNEGAGGMSAELNADLRPSMWYDPDFSIQC